LVHELEVASLDLLEELISQIADKSVIILRGDMHNEFVVAIFATLRQGFHVLDLDSSLELYSYQIIVLRWNCLFFGEILTMLLHVAKLVSGQ